MYLQLGLSIAQFLQSIFNERDILFEYVTAEEKEREINHLCCVTGKWLTDECQEFANCSLFVFV